jgi:quercetin dioxygenase-like cupin family protein
VKERLWFLDTLVTPHVAAESGSDGISVLESRARRGDSPPLHTHNEDEIWHVIDGEMTFVIGGEEHNLSAGESLLGRRGVPHTFRVDSEEARWLVITARGDFERFVRSFSRPAPGERLPEPSGPPTDEQISALTTACMAHGIELIGPPLH